MTINLEDYLEKTVEVELNGGVIRRGKLKKSGEHRAFPYSISLSYYNQYGRYRLLDEYSTGGDIIKIKEIKEPEMIINLEDYIGKTVEVELRNGCVIGGHKIRVDPTPALERYQYVLGSYLNFYSQDGTNETHRNCDIIKIKEIKETPTEPETMSNVIRSKIDIFTIEDERVEVTLDDDGLFLTACSKGAREDLSIGSKDLIISVARCILEHYGVDLK